MEAVTAKIRDWFAGLRMTVSWAGVMTYFGVLWGIEAISGDTGGWENILSALLLAFVAQAIFVRVDRTPEVEVKITNRSGDITINNIKEPE